MAKLNIYFNGKNYSIDESALADARAALATSLEALSSSGTLAAGLYVDGVMTKSWEDLISEGIMKVEDGVIMSDWDDIAWSNKSANHLVGDLIISSGGTSIGIRTFRECYNLTSAVIPDGVESIEDQAFYNCSNLTSIVIPEGVTSIGSEAFTGCSSLTSITIPDSVTSIGKSAFSGCAGLTSIEIPDGVTSIKEYVFRGCSSLISITIPDSVTSIGNYAFMSGCKNLSNVTFTGTIAQWNAISKDSSWDSGINLCPATHVHCTDGDVAL